MGNFRFSMFLLFKNMVVCTDNQTQGFAIPMGKNCAHLVAGLFYTAMKGIIKLMLSSLSNLRLGLQI